MEQRKTHAISSDKRKAVCGVRDPRYWSNKRTAEYIECEVCRKILKISPGSDQLELLF